MNLIHQTCSNGDQTEPINNYKTFSYFKLGIRGPIVRINTDYKPFDIYSRTARPDYRAPNQP